MTSLHDPQRQQALTRVLKACMSLPAKTLMYASALGAIVAIGGGTVPPELNMLVTGVGVNLLSSLIERVARGDKVAEAEMQQEVQEAIVQSGIEKLLESREFQERGLAHLLRQQDQLQHVLQANE